MTVDEAIEKIWATVDEVCAIEEMSQDEYLETLEGFHYELVDRIKMVRAEIGG
jgi:hypothetical protein